MADLSPAVLALAPEQAAALRDEHENAGCCAFVSCPGPDTEPVSMASCSFCALMAELAIRAGRAVKPALSPEEPSHPGPLCGCRACDEDGKDDPASSPQQKIE